VVALARLKGDSAAVALVQGLVAVAILALSFVLLPTMGITGVGIAAFAGNCVVAVVFGWKALWPAIGPQRPTEVEPA
jgi:O-antigen/teichoic acid export membrane protein